MAELINLKRRAIFIRKTMVLVYNVVSVSEASRNKRLIVGSEMEGEETVASDSKVLLKVYSSSMASVEQVLEREGLREGLTFPSMEEDTSLKKQKDQ